MLSKDLRRESLTWSSQHASDLALDTHEAQRGQDPLLGLHSESVAQPDSPRMPLSISLLLCCDPAPSEGSTYGDKLPQPHLQVVIHHRASLGTPALKGQRVADPEL